MLLASRQAPTVFLVLLLAGLCWAILAWLVIDMCHPIAMMTMPMSPEWSTSNFIAVFLMWAIMMAAMMLPSALPMIIIHRKMSSKSTSGVSTAVFTAAYLIIWSVFSIKSGLYLVCNTDFLFNRLQLSSLHPQPWFLIKYFLLKRKECITYSLFS